MAVHEHVIRLNVSSFMFQYILPWLMGQPGVAAQLDRFTAHLPIVATSCHFSYLGALLGLP